MVWEWWQFAPDLCLRSGFSLASERPLTYGLGMMAICPRSLFAKWLLPCIGEAPLKYGGIYIDMDHVSKRRLAIPWLPWPSCPVQSVSCHNMVVVDTSPEGCYAQLGHKFIDILFPWLGLRNRGVPMFHRKWWDLWYTSHLAPLSSPPALQWEWPRQQ